MNILADSVTTLNRNGLTTSIPATEVDKVVNAAKQGVRQAATHVQLPAPDLSPQTDDIADAVATKVVSQMDVKTHPYQAGDIKKNKDHGLDLVYKRRDEGKLDGYIDALEEAKKELNQDKLIWWW